MSSPKVLFGFHAVGVRSIEVAQALYRGNYYSGNNSMNPITNVNWPVYWCGIGKMGQQEMVDYVNLY